MIPRHYETKMTTATKLRLISSGTMRDGPDHTKMKNFPISKRKDKSHEETDFETFKDARRVTPWPQYLARHLNPGMTD